MGMGNFYVTQHALDRVRRRWPGAADLEYKELLRIVTTSLEMADHKVMTPGGTFYQFVLDGTSGFLVVVRDRVVTALLQEHCREVSVIMERKKNGSL